MVGRIRDRVMKIKNTSEFSDFYDEVRNGFNDPDLFRRCARRNDMYDLKYSLSNMRYRCQKQKFPIWSWKYRKESTQEVFPYAIARTYQEGWT